MALTQYFASIPAEQLQESHGITKTFLMSLNSSIYYAFGVFPIFFRLIQQEPCIVILNNKKQESGTIRKKNTSEKISNIFMPTFAPSVVHF